MAEADRRDEKIEKITAAVKKRRSRTLVTVFGLTGALIVALIFFWMWLSNVRLVEALRGGDITKRRRALQEAAHRWGDEALPYLYRALTSRAPSESEVAAELLRERLRREAKPEILTRLASIWEDRKAPMWGREGAIYLLAEFAGTEYMDFFLSKRFWAPDAKAWFDAGSRYMLRTADRKTLETLKEWAVSEEVWRRHAAARIACFLKDDEENLRKHIIEDDVLLDRLVALMLDDDYTVRRAAAEAVWNLAKERHAPQILEVLRDRNPSMDAISMRHHAVEAAGRLRLKAAVDELLALLREEEDRQVAMAAADALVEIGDRKALEAALALAGGGTQGGENWRAVFRILGGFGGERAALALAGYLMSEDKNRAYWAGWWLRRCEPTATKEVLRALREAPNPRGRVEAAKTLCFWRVREAIGPVVRRMARESRSVTEAMQPALEYMGDPRVAEEILPYFENEGVAVDNRLVLAEGLAFYRTPKAVRALARALGAREADLRNAAAEILRRIFGELTGFADRSLKEAVEKVAEHVYVGDASVQERLLKRLRAADSDYDKVHDALIEAMKTLPAPSGYEQTTFYGRDRREISSVFVRLALTHWTLKLRAGMEKAGLDVADLKARAEAILDRVDPTGEGHATGKRLAEEMLALLRFAE